MNITKLSIRVFGATDKGLMREENEDNLLVSEKHQLYAVADGLGGLPDGAMASLTAVEQLDHILNNGDSSKPLEMSAVFNDIHNTVCESRNDEDEIGMATTLTIAQLTDNQLHVGHMGDSGIFLFRKGSCEQLTLDHTMAEEMKERMSPEEAETIPAYFHHTLTRCIGQAGEINVDTFDAPVQAGDRVVLYTDGVTKTWEPNELLAAVNLAGDPEALVTQIVETANERGGPDNVTAVALFID